jgi:hypothetical protein
MAKSYKKGKRIWDDVELLELSEEDFVFLDGVLLRVGVVDWSSVDFEFDDVCFAEEDN